MRAPALLCLAACVSARAPRPAAPDALAGVSIALPAPSDERRSPGVGCGFVAQDLALRTEKALVVALSNAGARLVARGAAEFTLSVAIRGAGMGTENERPRRTDPPIVGSQPDAPPLAEQRASPFNSGNGRAEVTLEASLSRGGTLVWSGTVYGSARSAPCIQTMDKVREALQDAVERLRDDLIRATR